MCIYLVKGVREIWVRGSGEVRGFAVGGGCSGGLGAEPPGELRGRAHGHGEKPTEAGIFSPHKTEKLGKFATLLSIL